MAEASPPAESCLPTVRAFVEGDSIEGDWNNRDWIGDWNKGNWIDGEMIKGAPSLSHQRPGGAGATHPKQQPSLRPG